MKRFGAKLFILIILVTMTMGCSAVGKEKERDLQRLSKIDIYSQDGDLIRSITDEATLRQFSDVIDRYALQDTEPEQKELERSVRTLSALYDIVFYKTPASRFHDEALEEELKLTIYEDSDIVREIISPENIKNISVPEEVLTFYFMISDEDRALFDF